MKDDEIITCIKAKEYSRSAKHLYAYFPVIKKHILKNSGRKEDAEDIFQDSLLVLFNKINKGNFELSSALNTYLFGIAKNLWHEQLRRRNKEVVSELTTVESISIIDDVNLAIEENRKSKKALEAVSLLGEKCKNLLRLFYYEKQSMALIAKALGFTGEKMAKDQKYRCLEKAKGIYSSLN